MKSPITTHVLDVSCGRPAANLSVHLAAMRNGEIQDDVQGTTNLDGRIVAWSGDVVLSVGLYQLTFNTASYFESVGCREFFYPEVKICFEIRDVSAHYHVPLLLSPFGYSTYRGS